MPLVPAATEQENKWCTNSGEHKPAPCHNLCPCLLCQTLGKSAWWVKGSVFQGSVTAVWCSINACDMATYSKSCFLRSGMSSLLKPNYWCILTAVSTSHFDWPSAFSWFSFLRWCRNFSHPGLLHLPLPGPLCPCLKNPAYPPDDMWLWVAQCTHTHTHIHTTCGKAWGNLLLHQLSVWL